MEACEHAPFVPVVDIHGFGNAAFEQQGDSKSDEIGGGDRSVGGVKILNTQQENFMPFTARVSPTGGSA